VQQGRGCEQMNVVASSVDLRMERNRSRIRLQNDEAGGMGRE